MYVTIFISYLMSKLAIRKLINRRVDFTFKPTHFRYLFDLALCVIQLQAAGIGKSRPGFSKHERGRHKHHKPHETKVTTEIWL
jgi:hypothetical protein